MGYSSAEARRKYVSEYRVRCRAQVIEKLGGRCVCCGETNPEFLELDHVNDDGAEQRRNNRSLFDVIGIRSQLKKLGWVNDTYQILCCNCHGAKSRRVICPHVRAEVAIEALGF